MRTTYSPAERWTDAVNDFERAQRAAGYLNETVLKRCDHVSRLSRALEISPWEVTHEGLISWLDSLPVARSTRLDYRMSLRAFYRWAHRIGRVFEDPSIEQSRRATQLPVPEAWQPELRAFRTFLRSSGKPETTVGIQLTHLRRFARDNASLAPFDVTLDDLVEWLGAKRWAPETRRGHRSTLRSFYKWALATERATVDPAVSLPVTKPGQVRPRPASEEAFRDARAKAAPREYLALRLAGELGLRRGEIVLVHSRDLDTTPGSESLLVHGKGNKDRRLPLSVGLASDLAALPDGFAFPGKLDGHLSPTTIGKKISALLPAGVATHALRHRFATRAYEVDHDVFTVQQLLGHASPETTRRYVKTSDASLRRLVDMVAS